MQGSAKPFFVGSIPHCIPNFKRYNVMQIGQDVTLKETSAVASIYDLTGNQLTVTITEVNDSYIRVSNSILNDAIVTEMDICH